MSTPSPGVPSHVARVTPAALLKVPCGHGVHSNAASAEKWPAAQFSQADVPLPAWYVVAGHFVHALEGGVVAIWPRVQAVHSAGAEASSVEKCPAVQFTQAVVPVLF